MDWGRFQRSCVNIQQMHIPVSGNSCWLSDDLYNLFRLMISFARTGGQDNIYKSEVVLILPVLRTRPGLQNPPFVLHADPKRVPSSNWGLNRHESTRVKLWIPNCQSGDRADRAGLQDPRVCTPRTDVGGPWMGECVWLWCGLTASQLVVSSLLITKSLCKVFWQLKKSGKSI